MVKIIVLARILLFFLSSYGYVQYLRKSVRTEFSVGLLFSGISSILVLAGILNLLRITAWVLFFGGLFLTGYSIKQKQRVNSILCAGTVFFLLLAVLFPFLLYGSEFVHYDNFTHWAVAARLLIENHRFPILQDPYILFTSYPLGSACFIYYFCEIVGASSEWLLMYAQAILMAGMIVSLFAFAKSHIISVITALCCICLLCSNNSFFDLLVDNLLPITALGAAAFCIYYNKRNFNDLFWYFLPYAVFLLNIKNSGLLFVILLYGYIGFTHRQEHIDTNNWLILLAVPIAALILWRAHVRLVFPGEMNSPHSMSISFYRNHFGILSNSDILLILKAVCQKTFSPSNHALYLLLAGFLLWFVTVKSVPVEASREYKTLILFALISYLLYQIGTAGMYLFSMTRLEALRLASYDRYHQSIVTFITGVMLIGITDLYPQLSHSPPRKKILSVCLALCPLLVSLFVLSPDFSILHRQQLDGSMRRKFDCLIADYNIPENMEIVLVTLPENQGYLTYMAQYLLRPLQLVTQTEDTLNLEGLPYSIDYIIFFDESEKTKAFLSELAPECNDPVFQLY